MSNKYTIILLVLALSLQSKVIGQINPESLPSIVIKSRPLENKILLRWAVDQPTAWHKANQNGFMLTKYLYSKDGIRLSFPRKIWEKELKSAPLAQWENIVMKNDYAAIIAQALYGESFEIEAQHQGKLAEIANVSQDIEQRFSFSLMAADMNFEASKMAAWGYEDSQVLSNEQYVYQIKVIDSSKKLNIKNTAIIVGTKEHKPLPKPIDLQGVFGDKSVLLAWDYQLQKSIFTSYHVEKSENGADFNPLSKEPIVNMNNKPEAPSKRMFYIDSLGQNNKKYHYRVYGLTPFGEKSPYSKVISGTGRPILPFTPRITDHSFPKNQEEALIEWEFPKEGEALLSMFQLLHSSNDLIPYEVAIDSIDPSLRKISASNLGPSNYFKIKAVGKSPNQEKTSFSSLVQPLDSTPPMPPIELSGTIDTLGIVKISWKANTETDLNGYKVFRGFNKKEEPSLLTKIPIKNNIFTDTLQIKSLNSKIYYQVVAVDQRFNHSDFSEVLILERPDNIPPSSPIFSSYLADNGIIELKWINSPEPEVTHLLYKRNVTDNSNWSVAYNKKDTIQQFTDTQVAPGKTYQYAIYAQDLNGLISEPSTPVTITLLDIAPPEIIGSINSYTNYQMKYIEIFWKIKHNIASEYTIYKQVDNSPASTWKVVSANTTRLIDQSIHPSHTYTYHLKPILPNGKYGQIKSVEVKY